MLVIAAAEPNHKRHGADRGADVYVSGLVGASDKSLSLFANVWLKAVTQVIGKARVVTKPDWDLPPLPHSSKST